MKKYKQPKRVLKEVRARLDNPANFCRQQLSRPGGPKSDDGMARCALGWIYRLSADNPTAERTTAVLWKAMAEKRGKDIDDISIGSINDRVGRKGVQAEIDRAIA